MKQLFILIILNTVLLSASGQTVGSDTLQNELKFQENNNLNSKLTNEKLDNLLFTDTAIKISYIKKNHAEKNALYFINNIPVTIYTLYTIDPNTIVEVRVKKEKITFNNKQFDGSILIKLKENYIFKPVILCELIKNHLQLSYPVSVFMINNEIINANCSDIIINESYIYKIEVNQYENKEENINLNFINLITGTEENIRKSSEIKLRGGIIE